MLSMRARREVLPRAALGLFGVLLEEPFVEIAEPFGLGAVPVERVDALDDGTQVPGLAERSRRVGEDGLDAPRALATEVDEELLVEVEELDAVLFRHVVPAVALRNLVLGAGLFHHLEKEQERELGHVLVVGDPVVAENVAEVPELLNDVLGVHAA
jgi:hypothetical protein